MSKDSDVYGVVIIGSMNPRIHHPAWYQAEGIFSEEDVKRALQSQPVICTPAVSQFSIGEITIRCLPERWEITSAAGTNVDRIREIAQKTFDDLLPHTPVSIVALNFDYVRELPDVSVRDFIGKVLTGAATTFGLPEATSGDLALKRKIETVEEHDGTALLVLRSTDDPFVVSLGCNYQYNMRMEKFGNFRLDRFLPAYALRDRSDSERSLARLLGALNSATKE